MPSKHRPIEVQPYRGKPFNRFAQWAASMTGRPITFFFAFLIVVAWAVTGPMFEFSNTWQLFINTGTTVATFLMVFLIQNTQNRESIAMQIKLDELIRSDGDAHNALLDLENLDETELGQIKDRYEALAEQAREALKSGKKDRGIPEV